MILYNINKKIKTITNNLVIKNKLNKPVNKYTIVLDDFNIKQGIPSKKYEHIDDKYVLCYSDDDYTIAYNNAKGLQDAVDYAVSQGYNYIILPKGKYTMCYNTQSYPKISGYNGITIDLNDSTIKTIYDSEKANPYNTSTNPIYNAGGMLITISDCKNTFLCNGVIIGDKIDRSFKEQNEKAVEWTYGVSCGRNCIDCGVYNMDISLFMGDGFTCAGGDNPTVIIGYQMGWVTKALNDSGDVVDSTQYCTSNYINVEGKESVWLHGYGYTQGFTYLNNKNYTVAFYDNNKNYLGRDTNCYVLRSTAIPENCSYIKIQVEESSIDKDGWYMQLREGYYGQGISVRNNYIHHNHRGGMSIGVNDMYIRDNIFYRNGMYPDTDHSLPGFEQGSGVPFQTRYHINMEDSQGWNINIEDNIFIEGNLGIASRGMDYKIRNNKFITTGIILYKLRKAEISENKGCTFSSFKYDIDSIPLRDWYIHDCDFTTVNILGTSPITEFSDNIVYESFTTEAPINNPLNNDFFYLKAEGYNPVVGLTDNICNNCKFIKEDTSRMNVISFKNMVMNNCVLEGTKVNAKGTVFNDCTIKNCSFICSGTSIEFNNCTIVMDIDAINNPYPTFPYNAALLDLSVTTDVTTIILKNCNITLNNTQPLIGSQRSANSPINLTISNNTNITRTVNNALGLEICDANSIWNFDSSTISVPAPISYTKPSNSNITNMNLTNVEFTD